MSTFQPNLDFQAANTAAEDGEVAKEKLAEAMHAIKKLVKN